MGGSGMRDLAIFNRRFWENGCGDLPAKEIDIEGKWLFQSMGLLGMTDGISRVEQCSLTLGVSERVSKNPGESPREDSELIREEIEKIFEGPVSEMMKKENQNQCLDPNLERPRDSPKLFVMSSSPTVVQPWAEIAVDHSKPQMKLEYRPQNLRWPWHMGGPTRVFEEMVENVEGLRNLSTLTIKLKTSRVSYARICVEIEAKENLPDSFLIQCEEEVCEGEREEREILEILGVDMSSSGAKGHGMTFVSLKRNGTLGLRMWIVGIGLQLPNMFGSSFLEGNNPCGVSGSSLTFSNIGVLGVLRSLKKRHEFGGKSFL
ncbi:hypothetical protein Acr_01g0012320 [Actinidia rufa]|uniref:Uncharacterized protein n=1 Tax=Actinidia rufa TaxID=165716 RepID=A0A7J0E4J5_9ERIC|nr:hypothetical protein Acr_01g0012320 [Actinidia rufa]